MASLNTQPSSIPSENKNTPGSLSGVLSLPLSSESKELSLEIEGRVVSTSAEEPKTLIKAGLEQDSIAFTNKLRGEFAIFSQLGSKALFIRDFIGARPLYYSIYRDEFYFASRLNKLLSMLPEQPKLDTEALGFYLLNIYAFGEKTFYKNVFKLPAGHLLLLKQSEIKTIKYRDDDYFKNSNLFDLEQPEEEFRRLLKLSIQRRLGEHDKLGVLLSAGIDSSAIAKTTAALMEELGVNPGENLHTYSLRFEDPECDPGKPLEKVLKVVNSRHSDIFPEKDPALFEIQDSGPFAEVSYIPNLFMFGAGVKEASKNGVDIVCTGLGGDEIFTPGAFLLLDFLKTGRFKSFFEAFTDFQLIGVPAQTLFLRYILRPLIPNSLVKLGRKFKPVSTPAWLNNDFARQFNFMEQVFDRFASSKANLNSYSADSTYFRVFGWGGLQYAFEQHFEYFTHFGVSPSWPLLEQELIAFSCCLPVEKLSAKGYGKPVLRKAMCNFFPKEICYSDHYVDYSNLAARDYITKGFDLSLWNNSELVKSGIVSLENLKTTLKTEIEDQNFFLFLRMLHIEKLLRRAK